METKQFQLVKRIRFDAPDEEKRYYRDEMLREFALGLFNYLFYGDDGKGKSVPTKGRNVVEISEEIKRFHIWEGLFDAWNNFPFDEIRLVAKITPTRNEQMVYVDLPPLYDFPKLRDLSFLQRVKYVVTGKV